MVGAAGFTTTIHEMDVRPGGIWKQTMHGPDGTDYPSQSVFIEVVKPERIVYSMVGGKKVTLATNLRRRGLSMRKATRPSSLYECSSHRPITRTCRQDVWCHRRWKSRRLTGLGSMAKSSAG